jgi:hypothetical protein
MRPLRSPGEGRGGEVTAWQPEAPQPLPPDVRHICPRCGGEAEILQSRAQCLVCLLIFSPPRLPSWVVRALWGAWGLREEAGPKEGRRRCKELGGGFGDI